MTGSEDPRHTQSIEDAIAAWLDGQPEYFADFYGMMRYQLDVPDADSASQRPVDERRFASLLCLQCAEATGSGNGAALRASAALALLFASFRIHDDIERHHMRSADKPALWTRSGVPQAINTGDGLVSLAANAMLDSAGEVEESIVLARELANTCMSFMNGQHALLQLESEPEGDGERYLQAVAHTFGALGGYSAWVGAVLAGADEDTQTHVREFGAAVGTAFCIRESLDGEAGTEAEVRRQLHVALAALESANVGESGKKRLQEFAQLVIA